MKLYLKPAYVAGSTFTVAGITTFRVVDFLKRTDTALPRELGDMQRWYAEIAERPSAKA